MRRVDHLCGCPPSSNRSSLANTDKLDKDNYDVLVDVRAVCPDCGSDTAVGELIRRGGCGCTTESTTSDQD